MCNIQSPNTRALIIEVLENGKVSLPPVIHQPEHTLTIDELKKCRDYLDLIINNPNNFHIVKKVEDSFTFPIDDNLPLNGSHFLGFIPKCKSCQIHLTHGFHSQTERDNELCFKCEKELILNESNYQPIVVSGKDVFPITAITQNDDKICDWPLCDKVLNKLIRPNGWAKGHCLSHDSKKGVKQKPIKTQPPTDMKTII